jgi:phosphoribosylaminoimidazole-succinocarboxamide synthase
MESTDLPEPGLPKIRSGKVREVYDAGDALIIVATDRISAFDCILPDLIPGKGRVLTQLSRYWFERFSDVPNHMITADPAQFPEATRKFAQQCDGRAMLVKRAKPLLVEWVVRGFLAGSGWKEYRERGSVCGISLPDGLQLADILPEPILTPSTKAEEGHDEPISWEGACKLCGVEIAEAARSMALKLYTSGLRHAGVRGIILADTKFEFGLVGNEVILIDECMTPDSSRFWPAPDWQPGVNPPSFDKQYVRDYLESTGWNKQPPAPHLPEEVVERTAQKYEEALRRLTSAH